MSQTLFLLCLLLIFSGANGQQQPLEDYFFTSVPLVVVQYVANQGSATSAALAALADAQADTPDLLEIRLVQEFEDASTPSGPLSSARQASWQLWRSVQSYLARPTLFTAANTALQAVDTQWFFRLGGINGGCKYCRQPPYPNAVLAHFLNSQQLGAYPIQATFTAYLAAQTQQEPGTLDYTVTNPLTASPSHASILFDFDRLDFWEFYLDPPAFDTHVVNVNNTLRPQAANWFIDLGAQATVWHKVHRFTSGCYKCESSADAPLILSFWPSLLGLCLLLYI